MSTTLAGSADDLYRELGCAPDVSAAELKQVRLAVARSFCPPPLSFFSLSLTLSALPMG